MKTTCDLCFHHCTLEEGQTGLCRARGNVGGCVVCLNYGRLTAVALDPIEIPLHLSRFFPRYKVTDKGPTPAETVYALADEARNYLKWVYTGNL